MPARGDAGARSSGVGLALVCGMARTRQDRKAAAEREPPRELRPASAGSGPLLQRDYWAVVSNCRVPPSEVGEVLATHFPEFSPTTLASFNRSVDEDRPLEVGDELEVRIRMAGAFGVRVLHRDSNSITLGTLEGHPEAGRITFGAYPNDAGDTVLHIRSRARSSTAMRLAEYVAAGESMQTNTWTDFLNKLACTIGEEVLGEIHAETREVEDEPDEDAAAPTFLARGG
jgi:hypothetical protein